MAYDWSSVPEPRFSIPTFKSANAIKWEVANPGN
jgi:hypothetical protein